MRISTLPIALLATCLNAQTVETFASGLQFPQRLIFTPVGNLLVSEGGTPEPNTGRVSILDRSGNRRSLLEALPSGLAHFTFPFGPTGMAQDGRTLYLLLGEGDVMAGVPPDYGINLNGPSSPIFSSILRIQFSRDLDEIQTGFSLESVHHWALLDGSEVNLTNASGDRAAITLLTAFRPLVRNVLGGEQERVRPADPYAVLLDAGKRFLYVVDASAETISRVDTATGRYLTIYRFEPFARDTPNGTVRVDNVPTSFCWSGDNMLIGNLSAGPLPPGEAVLRTLDPNTRQLRMFGTGFSAITDIACLPTGGGGQTIVVAEFTTGVSATGAATGQVTLYEGGARRVLVAGIAPTGLAIHPTSGQIYAALLGGRIVRIPIQ